jgi:anthranilate phosphoribosyltransferase
LVVAGRAADLGEGLALAAHAIDSGAARKVLQDLVALTNGAGR